VFRRDMVRAIAGTRLNTLSRALRQRGLLAITAIRLVPVAPFAVENVVAGAIHIRARDYLLGTFFGMLPGELASTIFGQQLQAALLESSDFNWWLIAGVAALLALAAVGVRRFLLRIEAAGASPSRLQAETDP
jgi:phospholipase D1/2